MCGHLLYYNVYALCVILHSSSFKVQSVASTASGSTLVQNVKIPDRFSFSTMEALKSGNITRSVRIEIVAAVAFQVNSWIIHACPHVHIISICFAAFCPHRISNQRWVQLCLSEPGSQVPSVERHYWHRICMYIKHPRQLTCKLWIQWIRSACNMHFDVGLMYIIYIQGSWKVQLRQRLKNMRRAPTHEERSHQKPSSDDTNASESENVSIMHFVKYS